MIDPLIILALRLTQRGHHTLIIREADLQFQPLDMIERIRNIPRCVDLGLMTSEMLELGVTRYSLTESGRKALEQ